MIFLDKDTENKWKCRIFVSHIMSETQEIKDGLTVLEETEGREDATYDHIVKYTGFLGGIQVLTDTGQRGAQQAGGCFAQHGRSGAFFLVPERHQFPA